MTCVAIIPARYGSARFPGKPLATLQGRPLIAHVVERVGEIGSVARIVVATDDERIAEAAEAAGAVARMTSSELPSGTDRVAEAAREESCDIVLNVQGDEPLVDPSDLDAAVREFSEAECEYGTLRAPIRAARDLWDPNVVKVVVDDRGRALYFSRAPIPFPRDAWRNDGPPGEPALRFAAEPEGLDAWWMHVGVYLYRRQALERWARMPQSVLERVEGLEQLRVLQAGETMLTFPTGHAIPGVDTPDDLARVEESMARVASSDGDRGGAHGG